MTYYWRQENYNLYVLVAPDGSAPLGFDSYAKLYEYCMKHRIDAQQA